MYNIRKIQTVNNVNKFKIGWALICGLITVKKVKNHRAPITLSQYQRFCFSEEKSERCGGDLDSRTYQDSG